jgi:hypothetical protein
MRTRDWGARDRNVIDCSRLQGSETGVSQKGVTGYTKHGFGDGR